MGKYEPLYRYLMECGRAWVRLTYPEMEQILGSSLPKSARLFDWWWANEDSETSRHVQCRAWLRAGYDADWDRKAKAVIFRIREDRQQS